MKSSPFEYVKAENLEHVLELLDTYGDDSKLLAGGQSLLPLLALRLSSPKIIIDLELLAKSALLPFLEGDYVCIDALTRHVDLERSEFIAKQLPLLSTAAPWIAHAAIRNRGTLGGSLAISDPASEWPACALAGNARIHVQSKANGQRVLMAEDFFKGIYTTDISSNEMIVRVDFLNQQHAKIAFKEVVRRKGDYATVGLAALMRVFDHQPNQINWVYFGVADRPIRFTKLEKALTQGSCLQDTLLLGREIHEQYFEAQADTWHSSEAKKIIALSLMEDVIHEWF